MATMNFNTANNTFRQLLGNGLNYRVPPFQRDYSWSDDEWDDLWLDILGLSMPLCAILVMPVGQVARENVYSN